MLFPFRHEFEELFRGDRSIWLKMFGAAAVTDYLALRPVAFDAQLGARTIGILLVAASAAGAGIAILLSLKDIVERRRSAGQPVAWILQLYFTHGMLSHILWIVNAILFIVVAIVFLF